MQLNYQRYVDELIDMMLSGRRDHEGKIFGKRARTIGKELNELGGGNALFKCMDMLVEELTSEYSSEYLSDLRELEFAFSGISPDFQS